MTTTQILSRLRALGDPKKAEMKARKFAIEAEHSLGVYQSDLNALAREIGKNNEVALELMASRVYEARLLAAKIYRPKDVTLEQVETWTAQFENWEICDTYCMVLYAHSPHALTIIKEWARRKPEFEKRAAFATMAGYCSANKIEENKVFESFFPIIIAAADDDRNFVKKAVNWALRSIGKRNVDLKQRAIEVSEELLQSESKSAQWIARDALKELNADKVRVSDYPRKIYRK